MGNGRSTSFRMFPTTRWSLVARASSPGPQKRTAMGELLESYIPALRFHLRTDRRMDPNGADDLLQAFLADKVVQQDLIAQVERGRGRLRNFLLVALHRFAHSEWRRANARKRAADKALPLDEKFDAVDSMPPPGAGFDQAWAKQVLAEAMARMQRECESSGRPEIWEVFHGRVLAPALGQAEPIGYEQLVQRFRLASPVQASNLLITAKRTFQRTLREAIGEYAADEAEIDEELAHLREALRAGRT
jgi:DNA-directed RNA polymerase specialized sigma24 family protein